MSNTTKVNENPKNTLPQPETIIPNAKQSLRDMLADETMRTMNSMMKKNDSLHQFQSNPNCISPNGPQNAIPTNLGPEQIRSTSTRKSNLIVQIKEYS